MTIQVWADVGGTFTDCFVSTPDGCQVTKVLSSGIIRATVLARPADDALRLEFACRPVPAQFWVGAELSAIHADRPPQRIGTIVSADDAMSVVRIDDMVGEISTVSTDELQTVEVDCGLEAPTLAARLLLNVPIAAPLPALEVRLGTTRGTNALLTRQGATTALLITRGFVDTLRIGEQDRPELFDLSIRKPTTLTEQVVAVDERLDAAGRVLTPIDEHQLREVLTELYENGTESLAICLLHAHVNAAHEEICERIAREVGFAEISRSSEVAPLIKLVSRAETTTLDAYLNPILRRYVQQVWDQFGGPSSCRLRLMTSGGNLVGPEAFRGRDSILSGPAGGVVALGHVAKLSGVTAAIGLDMGGTSTDVSRFEQRVGRRYESRVAGVRVLTPMMDIHTVAAGGGSVCDYRRPAGHGRGRLTVGPESAGAEPGPACYGRGGPLTVTDVNLVLGRLPIDSFPFPLHRAAAITRLEQIAADVPTEFDSLEALADGFLRIAVTHMAEAVRKVSTAEGSDVRAMSLVGFGGAAGQHLCRVASTLGMQHIIDHPDASMLSALGLGLAEVGRVLSRGVYQPIQPESLQLAAKLAAELRADALHQLAQEEEVSATPDVSFEADVRYLGTEASLPLKLEPLKSLAERFHDKHRRTFGYARPQQGVELVAVRCEATLSSRPLAHRHVETSSSEPRQTQLWHQGKFVEASLIDRGTLHTGQQLPAPAVIASPTSTLIIEPGWAGLVAEAGIIELRPEQSADPAAADETQANSAAALPVLVEVVARRLQGIADAMGETLRRTAVSVNVKERRDYSCAVFRRDGSLIANAPHVPVHLGAMGHTVRRMIEVFPAMSPGDCYLSNDPYAGGSHLPDVTAVTPVFCGGGMTSGTPDFFVASRAHHAEIGGRTPGSMPPDATSLAEEGVVIRDFPLIRDGESYHDRLRGLLSSGAFPSRNVNENLADVDAQQAAGAAGAAALVELAERYTVDVVDEMMSRLIDLAGDAIATWIAELDDGPLRFRDALDDGTPIAVRIQRRGKRLEVDFDGSGPVHPHGFNATRSIVTAALMYVLRCLTGSELPLCEGVLRDVDLLIPSGLLNPPAGPTPEQCPAVVAGNVETSQRVVDVLLGALGVAAASQGTMNNVLVGDASFGYYETIGGGSGATPAAAGADAVHTHMTNTRITDPEVLESRLPIRLHRFAIRSGSGGAGKHQGGAGIVRELEFLRPLTVSLITSRRTLPPYGAAGGSAGVPGRNQLIRAGQVTDLAPTATIDVEAGDRLLISTPGGGGWGPADAD